MKVPGPFISIPARRLYDVLYRATGGRLAAGACCLIVALLGVALPGRAERLPIKNYTTADGLSRDFITRIVQDSRGFMWFCTIEGLSRFDGYQFKNYGPQRGLPSRYVNDFLETSKGIFWVATLKGLCRFDPDPGKGSNDGGSVDPERRFIVESGYASAGSVNVLFEDRQGTVWCGSENGLFRLEEVNGQWTLAPVDLVHRPERHTGDLGVNSIIEDIHGSLWISTTVGNPEGGLPGLYRRFPDGTLERFGRQEGLPADEITSRSLVADREGRIWVGTLGGLYELVSDPRPGRPVVARVYTTKDGLANNAIVSLFQSFDGRIWAGAGGTLVEGGGGLNEFVPDGSGGGRFRFYTAANGLSAISISAMAQDRDGNLWLGTETSGAMKLAVSGLTTFDEADRFPRTRVRAIFEDRAGELCVLGRFGFLNTFDGGKFTNIPLTLPTGKTYWGWGWHQIMLEDRLGQWWVATGQGLIRYPRLASVDQITRAKPRAVYTTKEGLPTDQIFRLFEDSRGDIWISTMGDAKGVLTRWERATETFHRYTPDDGIPQAAPTAFGEDASGNLWIGFYTGGLLRYREGRFTPFTADDGLPPGFIRDIYLDHSRRLWVATDEGGVARVDDPAAIHPHFIVYSTAEGLSSSQATCVTEDQWGRMYIGTGQGINRLDPATGNIKRYTTSDGLSNSYVYDAYRDRQGMLWFGTFFGLSRFSPRPDTPVSPPTVLITALRVGGAAYPISELGASAVTLPEVSPARNQIQVDFVGLGLGAGETLRYRYELEGARPGWSELSDRRSVDFANLKPGLYRFAVLAIGADGVESPSPAVVTFRILPPVWQRWWVLSLAFIAAAGLVLGLVRLRTARRRERTRAEAALRRAREERLRELEHVRGRIAADLHDDIGSNLTRISLLSEVAGRRIDGAAAPVRDQLTSIGKLSREVVDSMSEIVWAIDPQMDHLSDLSQRMRHFASDVLSARNIDFQFLTNHSDGDPAVGANIRREFFLVFKEGLNNIARHSECTRVEISFHIEGENLVLSLIDDGKGFNAAESTGGHGLSSMRDRMQSLGGSIEICSAPGKGTKLTYASPLRPQLVD